MLVFITKKAHHSYNYLLNWTNPDTGSTMGCWFANMTELREYIADWNAEIICTN